METKAIDNCCEYSGIYLEGRCKHFCHSKAPEKECDNNCLTFIKNGFCLHTGYPEAPTDESWTVEFDKTVAPIVVVLNNLVKGHGTETFALIKSFIASLLKAEREKAKQPITATEIMMAEQADEYVRVAKNRFRKQYFEAGKSEAFDSVRKVIMGMLKEEDSGAIVGLLQTKNAIINTVLADLLATLEDK